MSFITNKFLNLTFWFIIWGILSSVLCFSNLLNVISAGALALFLTDWCSKVIGNYAPRFNIRKTNDKAVLITGCDSGFGFQLALALDRLGFQVYAGCLWPCKSGAQRLKEEGKRIEIIQLDVTDQQQVDEAFQFVNKHLKQSETRFWALVNNAGIGAYTEIEFCPIEAYRRLLEVNAIGLIRVTKTFLPLLRHSGQSRVVIVASLAGRHTFPGFSAYSMSKHAAISFADALRLEMDKWNISVHTIEPTLYKTPISDAERMNKEVDEYWESSSMEIKESYGIEYLNDLKNSFVKHMNKAKPKEQIQEVIDDMVDAVAGINPKSSYVPNVITQIRSRILTLMPTDMRDSIFLKGQPSTPPANSPAKRRRNLVDPRIGRVRGFKRLFSMPEQEKMPITPPLKDKDPKKTTQFNFDFKEQ